VKGTGLTVLSERQESEERTERRETDSSDGLGLITVGLGQTELTETMRKCRKRAEKTPRSRGLLTAEWPVLDRNDN